MKICINFNNLPFMNRTSIDNDAVQYRKTLI